MVLQAVCLLVIPSRSLMARSVFMTKRPTHSYPGYDGFVTQTFCGRTASGGCPAAALLEEEIAYLSAISGRDLVAELQTSDSKKTCTAESAPPLHENARALQCASSQFSRGAGVDLQRHDELPPPAAARLPSLRARPAGCLDLLVRHLEHQFVMHLQQHLRGEPRLRERRLHADHGAADDVGGRALHAAR